MFGWFRRQPPGVHSGWSTTYVTPGFQPPAEWPTAREPGVRLRVVPNETLLAGPLEGHLGELIQEIVSEGADAGVSVELDTSDRTRPRERRGGASPVEVISLLVLGGAAGFGARQLERLGDKLFDAVVAWVLRHRRTQGYDDPVIVNLYGPDGEVLREVEVPQSQGQAPPQDRARR